MSNSIANDIPSNSKLSSIESQSSKQGQEGKIKFHNIPDDSLYNSMVNQSLSESIISLKNELTDSNATVKSEKMVNRRRKSILTEKKLVNDKEANEAKDSKSKECTVLMESKEFLRERFSTEREVNETPVKADLNSSHAELERKDEQVVVKQKKVKSCRQNSKKFYGNKIMPLPPIKLKSEMLEPFSRKKGGDDEYEVNDFEIGMNTVEDCSIAPPKRKNTRLRRSGNDKIGI